jgi:hypothetical protein
MRFLILLVSFIPVLAFAESPSGEATLPGIPDPPLPVQSGETLEPDITIIRRGNKTIHEYRTDGKLYKVKIIPDIGPAYYMIDSDGDGTMEEVRGSDLEKGINVQQWEIYSW